jgi:hypothetical protein
MGLQDGRRSVGGPWLLPAALLIATALAAAAGWWLVSALCACAAVALTLAPRRPRTGSGPPAPIAADHVPAVRAERERSGEVAAVRMLRTERPELSLVDAVRLVRDL